MALIQVTTAQNALPEENRKRLMAELGRLTYSAEGFGASRVAPRLTWTLFQALPDHNVVQATGSFGAPFYYVEVTTLAQALTRDAKLRLASEVSRALIACEGSPLTPEHLERVWVHFHEVADGNLVVGCEPASLASLHGLIALGE